MQQASAPQESPVARPPRKGFRPRIVLLTCLLGLLPVGAGLLGRQLRARNDLQAAQEALARIDLVRAQEYLDAYLRVRPWDVSTHLLAAQTARRRGALEEAERHLAAYEDRHGPELAAALERTLARAQEGDLVATESVLQARLREEGAEAALILEALAQGYLRTLHLAEARRCVEALLRRQPAHPGALLWRGQIHELSHRDADALRDYERVVARRPSLAEARLRLADTLDRLGRVREAAGQYAYLLARQPGDADLLLRLARCRYLLHDVAAARDLLETLLAEQPRHVRGLVERGRLAVKEGEGGRAEAWLRQALARAPRDREACGLLRLCLLQQGKNEEASQCLARLRQLEDEAIHLANLRNRVASAPHDPALRYEVGMALLRAGDEPQGVRWLLSALQEDPGYAPAQQALATYHQRQGPGAPSPKTSARLE